LKLDNNDNDNNDNKDVGSRVELILFQIIKTNLCKLCEKIFLLIKILCVISNSTIAIKVLWKFICYIII